MNLHGTNPDHPKRLTFYCRDCDFAFDSDPDGTGYEQAECPRCYEVCMTVDFERQEQERSSDEATFFSLLGSLTGLFHLAVPGRQQQRAALEPVAIVSYEDRQDAEQDAALLARHGIKATVELTGAANADSISATNLRGVELRVPSIDVPRAKEILHNTDSPFSAAEEPPSTFEDITFACEECGELISFPGERRGKVETCPRCHEYIDVPDG